MREVTTTNAPSLSIILYGLFAFAPFIVVALIGKRWGRLAAAVSIIPIGFLWFLIAQALGVMEHGIVPGHSWPWG